MSQPELEFDMPREQLACAAEPFHKWLLPDGRLWAQLFRVGSSFLIRFPDLADYSVMADGSRASCHPCPGTDAGTLEHLFLNQVRPLMLGLQGKLVFHGAAIETEVGALAFLAASGHGKSTLTAGLAVRGYRFLTDDCLVLEPATDGYAAVPGHPSVRLFEDSRDALLSDGPEMAAPVAFSRKQRCRASDTLSFCDRELPLRVAYVLGDGTSTDILIEPIQGGDRVARWVANSFLVDINDKSILLTHFDKIAALARVVPCFRLDYPRRYSIFDRLARVLADHSRELDMLDATE